MFSVSNIIYINELLIFSVDFFFPLHVDCYPSHNVKEWPVEYIYNQRWFPRLDSEVEASKEYPHNYHFDCLKCATQFSQETEDLSIIIKLQENNNRGIKSFNQPPLIFSQLSKQLVYYIIMPKMISVLPIIRRMWFETILLKNVAIISPLSSAKEKSVVITKVWISVAFRKRSFYFVCASVFSSF